jgi:hypothetical protein
MERFLKWTKKEGIIAPKLKYPVMFGTENYPYPGVEAKEEIKHREMLLAVPYDVIMTKEKARDCKVVNKKGDK